MIILSDQFKKASANIYTFSFVLLGIRYLPIKSVGTAGLTLDLEKQSKVVGALGLVVACCVASALAWLIRDFIHTRISDAAPEELRDRLAPAFNANKLSAPAGIRYAKLATTMGWAAFAIEAAAPLVLGAIVTVISFQDMVSFTRAVVLGIG